jgi:diguanylate cyclase (GGDEF)-like protein
MLVKGVQKKLVLCVILFFLVILLIIYTDSSLPQKKLPAASSSPVYYPQKQVLFISSYKECLKSVACQKRGIYEVFNKKNIHLDIEYMDMAHYDTVENENLFYQRLRYKLQHHDTYDAVLLGDDAALHFAEKHQNELFRNLPMVFFCVNDIDDGQKAGINPYITGIIEEFSLKETIDIAAKFHPDAKNVIAIYDNSLTGTGDQKQFFTLKDTYPEYAFSGINSSECTNAEFVRQLEAITNDSIVIYLDCLENAENKHYSISDSVQYITGHCPIPVYSSSFKGMGQGLIGGKLFSFLNAGRSAASLVITILDGTPVADIPVSTKDESLYCFDYAVLKKYNIRTSLVPRNAHIINKNPTFLEQYKAVLLPSASVLALMLLILIIVLMDNLHTKRFAYALQSYNLQLKEKEEQIFYQTKHDYLTGLPNRQDAIKMLSTMISESKSVTIMLMDIDDFKEINDSEGHACGDAILIEAGQRFTKLIHDENIYASRSGGDEFLLLTRKTGTDSLTPLLNKIKKVFEKPVIFNRKEHYLKLSIGIASSDSRAAKTSELIGNADLAMFSAKKSGKNTYVYYDSIMKTQFTQKKQIETLLREACRNDGFTVLYQPQVNPATGRTHCFEALVRLKDNDMTPGRFIPVAEETDLILAIGRIVTEKVITQMVEWRKHGFALHPVSINFSSKQIRDREYVNYLKSLLDIYNISPSLIEIEITESILLAHNANAMKLFADFTAIGVNLALDDFGTGYSSINYLTYIPVKKIKLDKSFIDTYLHEGKDAVIDNIIRLSHCLGLKITVEGIEKKEQCSRLNDFSCDYIQGYYFSAPVTGDKTEQAGDIYN